MSSGRLLVDPRPNCPTIVTSWELHGRHQEELLNGDLGSERVTVLHTVTVIDF